MKKRLPPDLPGAGRRQAVDVLRGTAIVLMIAYHFCFDLDYFGLIQIDMNNGPFWLRTRGLILSLFLGTMGVSLYLATARGVRWRPYLQRLGVLVGAAAGVTLVSWFMFPRSWIFFGVLHFIALASVLALPFVRLYRTNLVLGIALVGVGVSVSHPFFDHRALQWFGLMTHKPITEDYVPLLPWFGVVLLGVFLGRAVYERSRVPGFAAWESRRSAVRLLAWGGQHGLAIYLLHQPVLLGLLWLAGR
jgi:uncharacterized membrane protein